LFGGITYFQTKPERFERPMALNKDQKTTIAQTHARHEKDTGSPEVQIALLTNRINQLSSHLKAHKQDQSSRRGLLKLVGQRRKQMRYLASKNPEAYKKLIEQLGIRDITGR
jgi:small subunit ribosomal protein S15